MKEYVKYYGEQLYFLQSNRMVVKDPQKWKVKCVHKIIVFQKLGEPIGLKEGLNKHDDCCNNGKKFSNPK